MELKTSLASAFTICVVLGAAAWTATDPHARSAWRQITGDSRPTPRVSWEDVELNEAGEDRRLLVLDCDFSDDELSTDTARSAHSPCESRVRLVIDPKLAKEIDESWGTGRCNEKDRRELEQPYFEGELETSLRLDGDGGALLVVWIGDWSFNEWTSYRLEPGANGGTVTAARGRYFLDIAPIRSCSCGPLEGEPFKEIEGEVRLRHWPVREQERVPYEVDVWLSNFEGPGWRVRATGVATVTR